MRGLRFYEKHPTVRKAVELLFVFPKDFQTVIANGLSVISEKEFHTDQRFKDLKSLGTDKILAVHKSKNKKRPYDNNPVVHHAMNCLMILSEEERVFIAVQILELMGFIQDYIQTCKVHATPPTVNTVEAITQVYTQFGPAESKQFLETLQKEFMRKIQKAPKENKEPALQLAEGIQLNNSDMRIVARDI